jgi:hypothetical protein
MIKLKALLFEQAQTETVNQKITRLYNEVNGTIAQLNADITATGEEQMNRTRKGVSLTSKAGLSGIAGGKALTMEWVVTIGSGGTGKTGNTHATYGNFAEAMKPNAKNVSSYPLKCAWSFGTTTLWTPQSVTTATAKNITTAFTKANNPGTPKSLAIWNTWISQNAPKISELLNTIISAFPDGSAKWEESPGNGPQGGTYVVGGDKPVATAPTAAATTPPAQG